MFLRHFASRGSSKLSSTQPLGRQSRMVKRQATVYARDQDGTVRPERSNRFRCALRLLCAAASSWRAVGLPLPDDVPSPEEYAAHVGGDAHVLPPGELKLDGRQRASAASARPCIDSQLDDYGAAYPGFLILNPRLHRQGLDAGQAVDLLARVRPPVPRPRRGDGRLLRRAARPPARLARRGGASRRSASFISPSKGDSMHFSGSQRCEYMRKCFADPSIR